MTGGLVLYHFAVQAHGNPQRFCSETLASVSIAATFVNRAAIARPLPARYAARRFEAARNYSRKRTRVNAPGALPHIILATSKAQ